MAAVAAALPSLGLNSALQTLSVGGPALPVGALRAQSLERLDLRGAASSAAAPAGDAAALRREDVALLCAALKGNASLRELDVRPAAGLGRAPASAVPLLAGSHPSLFSLLSSLGEKLHSALRKFSLRCDHPQGGCCE